MSWSTNRTGTPAAVSAAITEDLTKAAAGYAGKTEEKDVLAALAAIQSAIVEMDIKPSEFYPNWGVAVAANGSRSSYGVTMNVSVTRVSLTV